MTANKFYYWEFGKVLILFPKYIKTNFKLNSTKRIISNDFKLNKLWKLINSLSQVELINLPKSSLKFQRCRKLIKTFACRCPHWCEWHVDTLILFSCIVSSKISFWSLEDYDQKIVPPWVSDGIERWQTNAYKMTFPIFFSPCTIK